MIHRLARTPRFIPKLTSKMSTVQNPLPASFLRGGTSKGVFISKDTLPPDRADWAPIFLGIMGSPDAEYGRQLDGMGGGVSSLSKVMVVGPPSPAQRVQGIDAEYTFAQVGITEASVDYSGNCGNLTSMIGVFAVDEGLCPPPAVGGGAEGGAGRGTIRCFNTNTQKIIDTTFPVTAAGVPVLNLPETEMAGVPGKASRIVLDFVDPGGARTGRLLPTGSPCDTLALADGRTASASLVDATNPTVFVDFAELDAFLPLEDYLAGKPAAVAQVSPVLDALRKQGAVRMGLDPAAQAQPKIALLRAPHTPDDAAQGVDIVIHALSMGVLHKAVPMTVGLCLGVASKIEGTIAWTITKGASAELVRIRHPGGVVDVGAEFGEDGQVKSAKVVRTGRRLMKGVVWH